MRRIQSCPRWGQREGEGSQLDYLEMIAPRMSFRGNGFPTVQELHRSDSCRKCDYPANTDCNVATGASLCTKTVSGWQKMNPLISSEPTCEWGFPRIHILRGVDFQEIGDRRE